MVLKSREKFLVGAVVILFMLATAFGLYKTSTKLTFLEYTTFNDKQNGYTTLFGTGESLSQEFTAPYDILHGIAVKVGTFNRVNNSIWKVTVLDAETNRVIASQTFFASLLEDNAYYQIELDQNVRVEKGKQYVFTIQAEEANSTTAIAFYTDTAHQDGNASLKINGTDAQGVLCFKVYGGDIDLWWSGYIILIAIYFAVLLARIFVLQKGGKNVRNDLLIQCMIVAGVTFLLLFTFSHYGFFTDELDNIHGGIIIANGGVLYKDYITQHTPVTYYLCAIFAMFGASSLEQFRISYYLFEAVVWGLVYFRYSPQIGKKKMFLLPVLETIIISSIIVPQGIQILSDGIQGICTVVMLLEFLLYLKDKKIGWVRSIIMSVCLWGAIGAAFISVYALVWIVLIFFVAEGIYIWKESGFSLQQAVLRYYKLLVSVIVPPVCAVIYFAANGCLRRAFDMFYMFNRDVYPKYTGGFGNTLAQPFVEGVNNFFAVISENVISIMTANASVAVILQLAVILGAFVLLLQMARKKKYVMTALLALVMVFSATRGYDFHGLAAWYVAVFIIVLHENELFENFRKQGLAFRGIFAVLLLCTYIGSVTNNLMYKQASISEFEHKIIELTEDKENQNIFYDAYAQESLYLHYKNRNPVNPGIYVLPWYMAWYEQDNINSVLENKPSVVVYNEDVEVWGYQYYSNGLVSVLKENGYERLSQDPNDGWEYCVWVR